MAESPLAGAEGVLRVSITSDGTALEDTVQLVSVSVHGAVNGVPWARLVFIDGDMPASSFPLSDAATLKPGAELKISAGYGDEEEALFTGLIVKHGVRIDGRNDARLVVECRHAAVKMTIGRKNANYVDQTDGDVINTIVGSHGLSAEVDSTTPQLGELVQHYCTDWDFVVARAEVNGLIVLAGDGKLTVQAPKTDAAAVLKIGYGIDLIDFHAEMDARTQYTSAKATAWDPATQAVRAGAEAAPPTLNAQGNLDGATLAQVIGLPTLRLQSGAPVPKEGLDAWAKAQQLKAGLARIHGRMTFQGSAKAVVGSLIEVAGVGERFSGTVFVTGVDHEIADGQWTTSVDFGLAPGWFTERTDVVAPASGGLLPGVHGLHVGIVKKLDGDPDNQHRIQVSVPVLEATTDGVWARLMQFHGSNGFGAFFVPEVGDEVVLGWFDNDPSFPVVLGSLYSSKQVPPYTLEAENNTKAIVTRCKSKVEFDEKDKIITVTTPGNNKIVLSDKDKSILLQDQNSNKVELAPGGITVDSPKDIKITAKGTVTIDAVGAISISSKADVKSAGLNVSCEAQVGFTGKGSASAELSAAGQTTVKGAMVMIN